MATKGVDTMCVNVIELQPLSGRNVKEYEGEEERLNENEDQEQDDDLHQEDDFDSSGHSDGMKRIVPSFVFDVVFPSLDVYSDLSLIIEWFIKRHWIYAISMSMPVLLQFLFTIHKWVRLEKSESKKWSWLFLLIQFWPQWRAIRAMNLDCKNDEKAERKKKELMREVTSTEPYLEAWPSIIIMTVIMVSASFTPYGPSAYLCEEDPEQNRCAVFGGFGGSFWFFTTYSISVFTGSLGITKFVQVGPFSVLSNEGALGGICKWRFFFAYLAVMFSIVTKGLLIGTFIGFSGRTEFRNALGTSETTQTLIATSALLFGLLVIPNLIFAFASIASSTGFNMKFFKIIFNYPAAWMLPIATYFAIGPRKISCCSKQKCLKNELGVSKKLSAINMTLTVMIYAAFISYFYVGVSVKGGFGLFISVVFVPILISGLVFNIIFLLLDEKCCCARSQNCFCSSCCGQNCYEYEGYYINTKSDILDMVKTEN